MAGGGRVVYALGYFNHVIYQYDTKTGAVNAKAVGGGHVSRNFFADDRGHVFVPRVVREGATHKAVLVELDSALREVASQPLGEYFERGLDDSHGIVAVHPDGAGGWFFTTVKGRLYQVEPRANGPFSLADRGWFHPGGPRYVASMFRESDGRLFGVAYASSHGGREFEWVARGPEGSAVAPLPYAEKPTFPGNALVYGSMTRDAVGRFYAVGTMNHKPVVLQITPR